MKGERVKLLVEDRSGSSTSLFRVSKVVHKGFVKVNSQCGYNFKGI